MTTTGIDGLSVILDIDKVFSTDEIALVQETQAKEPAVESDMSVIQAR